jgi:hypothetical protein
MVVIDVRMRHASARRFDRVVPSVGLI